MMKYLEMNIKSKILLMGRKMCYDLETNTRKIKSNTGKCIYVGSIWVASGQHQSIEKVFICIGYVSVILHAGREETGANRRTSARDKQGMSKG